MTEYKHVELGYSFKFTWPDEWDDDLKVLFLLEASRGGNRVTLPMNEGHLIEAAAKKAAEHAQR